MCIRDSITPVPHVVCISPRYMHWGQCVRLFKCRCRVFTDWDPPVSVGLLCFVTEVRSRRWVYSTLGPMKVIQTEPPRAYTPQQTIFILNLLSRLVSSSWDQTSVDLEMLVIQNYGFIDLTITDLISYDALDSYLLNRWTHSWSCSVDVRWNFLPPNNRDEDLHTCSFVVGKLGCTQLLNRHERW